jgi:hypothetical protein
LQPLPVLKVLPIISRTRIVLLAVRISLEIRTAQVKMEILRAELAQVVGMALEMVLETVLETESVIVAPEMVLETETVAVLEMELEQGNKVENRMRPNRNLLL